MTLLTTGFIHNWGFKMINRIKFWLNMLLIPIYTILFFIVGQKLIYEEYKGELRLAINGTKRKYNIK